MKAGKKLKESCFLQVGIPRYCKIIPRRRGGIIWVKIWFTPPLTVVYKIANGILVEANQSFKQ